jgi:hypothetical protein
MVEPIDNEVKRGIKLLSKCRSLTCDEVTSMYNASWANVHGYIVQDWCCIPLLLNVQHVFFGSKVDSLTLSIMNYLMTQGGL